MGSSERTAAALLIIIFFIKIKINDAQSQISGRDNNEKGLLLTQLWTVVEKRSSNTMKIPSTNFPLGCAPVSYQPPPQMPHSNLRTKRAILHCGSKPADIQFLLDVSGSVKKENFQKVLDFMKHFVNSFTIGPYAVQVGVTIFSTNPSNVFWLKDHEDTPSLLEAIDEIPYTGGRTHTHRGLDFVLREAFTAAHGDRPNAKDILIVITDGKSRYPSKTKTASEAFDKSKINVFAIGIGKDVVRSELRHIASTSSNVFTVKNYDLLKSLHAKLRKTACEGKCFYNATRTNYGEGERWKDGPLNCLCIDGDDDVYKCNHICRAFTCPHGYRCHVEQDPNFPFCELMSVADPAYPAHCPTDQRAHFSAECTPVTYNPPPTLPPGVTVSYSKGSCRDKETGKSYHHGEQWQRGCRENCVCLDGNRNKYTCKPKCKQLTCPPGYTCTKEADPHNPCCQLLRMTIPTLPSHCDTGETPPRPPPHDETHPGHPPHDDTRRCKVLSVNTPTVYNVTDLHKPTDCGSRPADIHFLVDSSASVGEPDFQKTKEFIKHFAQSLNISRAGVRIGVTSFSTNVHRHFWMNDHVTVNSLVKAIDAIPYIMGSTRLDKGLDFAREQAFRRDHGDRPGVENILVVITDGEPTNVHKTRVSITRLRKANIKVLAVGVGKNVDHHNLVAIASDPSYVYSVKNFNALKSIEEDLKAVAACEGSCHFRSSGTNHKAGETWTHGCSLSCTCLDGKTGLYQCRDQCKRVPDCPRGYKCTVFRDPANHCCGLKKACGPLVH